MDKGVDDLKKLLTQYYNLGIDKQIDYKKFYLYSIITHSTAIEGSTITELENQMMFDEGLSIKGRSIMEQLMNLDLKAAYEESIRLAENKMPVTVGMLKLLAAKVMKNTGQIYHTALGSFSSADGDLRLLNVTAGVGGRSYMNYSKVPSRLQNLCDLINESRGYAGQLSLIEKYNVSFDAHYDLATIHPWADGNGRMARLLMNHLQFEFGLVPARIEKEDKAEYIKALVETREFGNYNVFRKFMVDNLIKNLKKDIANYLDSINEGQNSVTGKVVIDNVQIFSVPDGYKIACHFNGQRQLGIKMTPDDCSTWLDTCASGDQKKMDAVKQSLADKYFNPKNIENSNGRGPKR